MLIGFVHELLASIFLRSLAPPELPGFIATMNALTSAGWFFVPVGSLIVSPAHEHRLVPDRSHCFMCLAFCTIPSPTTPLPPAIALTRYPSAWQTSEIGLGFARCQEARQTERTNRVHFRYGLVILLQLFPTPPHDDAVTFRYRPESAYRKRTSTSPTKHTNSHTGPAAPAVCLRHKTPHHPLTISVY